MNKIIYGDEFWQGLGGWEAHIQRKVPAHKWRLAKGARKGKPIDAYINHGRWVADCPYCAGAEVVDPIGKRFFCFSCQMTDNKGKPLPVKFPAKKIRERIEVILLLRPFKENQNWYSGESVQDLKDENIEHGLEV